MPILLLLLLLLLLICIALHFAGVKHSGALYIKIKIKDYRVKTSKSAKIAVKVKNSRVNEGIKNMV